MALILGRIQEWYKFGPVQMVDADGHFLKNWSEIVTDGLKSS